MSSNKTNNLDNLSPKELVKLFPNYRLTNGKTEFVTLITEITKNFTHKFYVFDR